MEVVQNVSHGRVTHAQLYLARRLSSRKQSSSWLYIASHMNMIIISVYVKVTIMDTLVLHMNFYYNVDSWKYLALQ